MAWIRWFSDVTSRDIETVGGKNAALGEMINVFSRQGIQVPGGFAVTVDAYRRFLEHNDLHDAIKQKLTQLDDGDQTLADTGQATRDSFRRAAFPDDVGIDSVSVNPDSVVTVKQQIAAAEQKR